MLYPHRLDGVSLFDRLGEVQEIKTRALRDWIENSRKVNRPRLGVDESSPTSPTPRTRPATLSA